MTHARRATSKAQPLSPNVPPAQYLWGRCPGSRASLAIYSEFARLLGLRSSKTMRPRFEDTPQPLVIAPLKTAGRMLASLSSRFCIHATPEPCRVTLEERDPSFCAEPIGSCTPFRGGHCALAARVPDAIVSLASMDLSTDVSHLKQVHRSCIVPHQEP